MSFEDIPEDREISYPCEKCDAGSITHAGNGLWGCNSCDFYAQAKLGVKESQEKDITSAKVKL